jgi:DNA-binding response OmpR family regulator
LQMGSARASDGPRSSARGLHWALGAPNILDNEGQAMAPVILLAERDEVLSASYETFLVAEGFRVVVTTTALGCLEVLRRSPPRLLVLDPELLWGGGMGILAVLAEDRELSVVPVLVLTDRPDAVVTEFMAGRPVALMLKPLAPAALASLVRVLCPPAGVVPRSGCVARECSQRLT